MATQYLICYKKLKHVTSAACSSETISVKYISRILKANSSWFSTWAKLCQLIASLSVILLQLNLTELKLEYLKFGFWCKNNTKIFCITRVRLFSSSAKVCFQNSAVFLFWGFNPKYICNKFYTVRFEKQSF